MINAPGLRPYWYLAGPYAHPNPEVRDLRFHAYNHISKRLMNMGVAVFSPITHGHPISSTPGPALAWAHEDWLDFDLTFVYNARGLLVAELPNWHNSRGVSQEITAARQWGKPVVQLYETRTWILTELGEDAWEALGE